MAQCSMAVHRNLLCSLAVIFIWLNHGGAAQKQPTTDPLELEALKTLAASLKVPSNWWNFSVDPCSGLNGWNDTANANSFIDIPTTGIECSCDNTTCHVTRIVVVSANVDGQIPPEIGNFSFLNDLNLGQNVISGRLPEEIGLLTNLQYFNVAINKLSGPFPTSFGKLTKLISMGFGSNPFAGRLPNEIGNLQSLRKIYMDFCGLGGPLPDEFGNLTKLETIWMAGNSFNGTIPEFMGKLVNLQDMKMHGNNFQGQIPASLGNLRNLKTLDLGDISSGGTIPATLNQLTGIRKLILRNCDLSGPIPDLSNLTTLTDLDLSFNNLTGTIPTSLWSFPSLQNFLLGSNQLTGQLPSQLPGTSSLIRLDVSYNELTGAVPSWLDKLQQSNIVWNRFDTKSDLVTNCLQARANCSRLANGRNLRFAVNCGGPRVTATTGTVYSEDTRVFTMGTYYSNNQDWAVSGTGYSDGFVKAIENTTVPVLGTVDPILYQTARSAPSSLRYYGLGLINGKYKLELNFAEIKLDNSTSWVGNTRRLFDVYIQGSLLLREFNIQNEAGGSSRALIRRFENVTVSNSLLEIHFQWKGKGTCCHGPLISAIKLTPEFDTTGLEPVTKESSGSTGLAAGLGVGLSVLVLVLLAVVFLIVRKRRQLYESTKEFRNMESKPDLYSYNDLKTATRSFAEENKLGQGGFGAVYKGVLANGTVVAVKQLSSKSQQGSQEFLNEVTIISAVQHRNLVKLHGCCVEASHRMLVYEYLENNSLHHVLLSSKSSSKYHLDWSTRFNICIGVARGLAYLHEDSKPKIVHRDIKASNVLLDEHMHPKVADFGLAKLFQDHETHVTTRVAGTFGYLAPEYAMRGQLTEKADVYSFGVLLLEIVSGRNNLDMSLPGEMVYLLEWAWNLFEKNSVLDLVDQRIKDSFSEEEVLRVTRVALLCSQAGATSRPLMSHVVAMLVGTAPVDVSSLRPGYFSLLKDAAPGFFSDGGQRKSKNDSAGHGENQSSATPSSSQTFSSQSIPSQKSINNGR